MDDYSGPDRTVNRALRILGGGDSLDAHDLARYEATFERRFSPSGKVAHLLQADRDGDQAMCGMTLGSDEAWLGTGDQDERDKAAALPPCQRCAARLQRFLSRLDSGHERTAKRAAQPKWFDRYVRGASDVWEK